MTEDNLKIERPSLHIFVEISKIRIIIHRLEFWSPSVVGSKHLGQSGLSAADISSYRYMHIV